jgi:hypothetical protein
MLAAISMQPSMQPPTSLALRPTLLAVLALAWLLLAAAPAHAQALTPDVPPPATGPTSLTDDDPEALADRAVEAWLDTEPRPLSDLSGMDAEEVCRVLPGLFAAPPPPSGTEVDLADRRERDTGDEQRRRYTYAAEIPPDRLDVVEVILVRENETWRVERVGFQVEQTQGRSWLQSTQAGWVFGLITVLFIVAALRPSPLKRWLEEGRAALRKHRRLVTWTMVGGWAVVGLGLWSGSQLPDTCETAVITILSGTLERVGAQQALASGELARTALVIFYQNFVVVTLTALFGSALLLGVPAYLLAGLSFLAQTTAFGVLGLGGGVELLLVGVLFVLEFTAYFLVVSGGGMLVATLAREGLTGLGNGYRKLFSMLPWAAALLLIGAWYEALILVGI